MNPTNIQRLWMSDRMAFAVDFALLGGCLHRVDLLTAFPWRVTLMVGFWNLPANALSRIFLDWSRLACLLLRAEKPISEDTNSVARAVIKNRAKPVVSKIHLRWLVLANKSPNNVRLAAFFCSIRSIFHSLSSSSIHQTPLNNIRNILHNGLLLREMPWREFLNECSCYRLAKKSLTWRRFRKT